VRFTESRPIQCDDGLGTDFLKGIHETRIVDVLWRTHGGGLSMQSTKIIDRLPRGIAFVHAPMGAILGLPLVMLGALMAPTSVSSVASVLAVMIVVTIVVWVMICCVKPDTIAPRFLRGR